MVYNKNDTDGGRNLQMANGLGIIEIIMDREKSASEIL